MSTFGGYFLLVPFGLGTAIAFLDNGVTVKKGHQPDFTGFVSSFDSTRFKENSQSCGGDI